MASAPRCGQRVASLIPSTLLDVLDVYEVFDLAIKCLRWLRRMCQSPKRVSSNNSPGIRP